MKKLFSFVMFFCTSFLFAQTYHISNVNYDITSNSKSNFGTTKAYALEQKVPVDRKTIFDSESDFLKYLGKYNQELNNLRAFESIEVTWYIDATTSNEQNNEIILNVKVKDSFHFLALPHVISYNSNEGWKPKLKAKDTNFLGSLNTMSSDLFAVLPIASENQNYEVGAEFSFNLPFKAGIFDAEWINDYMFSFDFSKPTPEWYAKTGLKLIYPIDKVKLQTELYQYAIRDYNYESYGDSTYYREEICFSLPISICSLKFLGNLYYDPYAKLYVNWDFDSINIQNTDLSSPTLTVGHSLNTGFVDWIGNYRRGCTLSLSNDFYYYFQRNDFIPYLAFDANYYNFVSLFDSNYFSKLGLSLHFNIFHYFNKESIYYYSNSIGSYLRGIRDDQYFSDSTTLSSKKALDTSTAILLNFDIPFHLFTTNFTSKIMSYFNCDVQISPFIDIALCHNLVTGSYFDLKDGFYAGGIEVLVYPKKWSSFTIRGSLGLDLGKILLSDYLNNSWRRNVSLYEISVGLGLQY